MPTRHVPHEAHSAATIASCCAPADTARKLGRLTGLLIEAGRPGEAVPLLRRALAAAEDEDQVQRGSLSVPRLPPARVSSARACRVVSSSTDDECQGGRHSANQSRP